MSSTLKRGAACTSCRRRKVVRLLPDLMYRLSQPDDAVPVQKCSGARPACDQCTRVGIEADCKYTDNARLSHTETLEREIEKLKSRLQELEPPMPIMLHDPSAQAYTSPTDTVAPPETPYSEETEEGAMHGVPAAYDDGRMTSDADMYFELRPDGEPESPVEVEQPQASTAVGWWDLDQPPQDCILKAVPLLSPQAPGFGFFLDPANEFHTTDFSDDLPTYKLLFWNAVVLWAIHVERDPNLSVHEPAVLTRTLSQLRDAVGHITSESFLYVLQGEITVAYYLLRDARWHEARYHANAAAMLALDFGIGAMGRDDASGDDLVEVSAFQFYPGRSYFRLAEDLDRDICTDAFYSVCILDRCLAVLLGTEAVIRPELTEELFLVPGHGVVQTRSALFLEANASDLLYRATVISKQENIHNNPEEQAAAHDELDGIITSFLEHVDANRAPADPGLEDRTYITLKSLLLMARIQLRLPFENSGDDMINEEDADVRQARHDNREMIVDALVGFSYLLAESDTQHMSPFNPVLANIWIAVCHLLYVELKHVRDGDGADQSKLEKATRLTDASVQLVHELLALGETIPLKSFREKFEAVLPLMTSLEEAA
ncbi:hypothetical protein CONPUDRAFT_170002 [Coniophora puteana RWD-64-598 SS2]|uniref:Zn(2)-C6 fungal-type domain-containing protein n=1 Tax=Coniophora puteana (strain RWD-64-598) TaxID=741705 RepID=R7SHW6_CONPW|nr:uncharacterized protein CONPUDRAFT_170002 [Coniophora puteana RWD-64-598 SS2]EIW74649.1 hypothetical protein CONPUDRAFT_170002 [Coniophora puteana RWD-64-598 SS2]